MPLAATALPALKPNQPNQSRPEPSSTNGTLCGSSAGLLVVRPASHADHRDGGGHGGVDVHDRAAGEVERAHLEQPAAAPHHVRQRRVDEHRPEADERHVGREPHALDDRARDQRRRDDGERALEAHEQHVRNQRRARRRVGRSVPTPRQEELRRCRRSSRCRRRRPACSRRPPRARPRSRAR